MKRLLLALVLCALPSLAHAQCNGKFANNTVCGNVSGQPALPGPVPVGSLPASAGGTNGQVQYNSSGSLAGTSLNLNQPVVGTGAGNPPGITSGTKSGSTNNFATVNGSLTPGNCPTFDASGNFVDSGGVCLTGTKSGNTSSFATTTGVLSNGHCAAFDASGNVIDSGVSCSTAGRTVLSTPTTYFVRTAPQAVTITNASPAVVTLNNHGFLNGQQIVFSTNIGGGLPTGITGGQIYFVIATGLTTNTFQFSATLNGTAVNTSSAGSGTFVLQAGNSAGNGSAATPTQAFLNPQDAIDYIGKNIDLGLQTILIQLACSGGGGVATYGQPAVVGSAWVGGKQNQVTPQVVLSGDTTTPSNCLWSPLSLPPNSAILAVEQPGANIGVQGIDFLNFIAGEEGILADTQGVVWLVGNLQFGGGNGNTNAAHMEARTGGRIIAGGISYSISAGSYVHTFSRQGGYFEIVNSTVTLTGTPGFTVFAYADLFSDQHWGGTTFVGSATGIRHIVQQVSLLDTGAVATPATFFPGNAAGTPGTANTWSTSGSQCCGLIR